MTAYLLFHFFFLKVNNPCQAASCSHLCLLIPGGYRCSCPDGSSSSASITGNCNAAFEQPRAQPYQCPCRNGGACVLSEKDPGKIVCRCAENFEGSHCEEYIPRSRIGGNRISSIFASIVLPIIIVILALLLASGLFMFFRKRHL